MAYNLEEWTQPKDRVLPDVSKTEQEKPVHLGTLKTEKTHDLWHNPCTGGEHRHPDGKFMWIFDTEHKHLEDLVEDGLAHKVRLEDLAALGPSFFRPTHVDAASFFNPASLRAIIARHVLMRSA